MKKSQNDPLPKIALILALILISALPWIALGGHSQEQFNFKQIQWQKIKKLENIMSDPGNIGIYYLSTDPNHQCADLNFDGKVNFYDYAEWIALGRHSQEQFYFKQIQWQKLENIMSDLRNIGIYWLSTDPNHQCADLNFDGIVNFYDYAEYLKMKQG
jgi:hypothetical protein